MTTENRHITRQNSTEALFKANGDAAQSNINTDATHKLWSYWDESKTNLYYMANQYYWNGAADVYCDVAFNDVEAKGDFLATEYIKRAGGTDDSIRFENDKISFSCGGVTALVCEDDKIYSALKMGLGVSSPASMLDIAYGPIDTSLAYGVDITYTPSTTATAGHTYAGLNISVATDITSGQVNAGSVSGAVINNLTDTNMEGTLNELVGLSIQAGQSSGTGSVSSTTLLNLTRWHETGTSTSSYGLKINLPSESAPATNNWSIYVADEADIYLEGDVGIGKSSPNTKLDIDGSMALKSGTIPAWSNNYTHLDIGTNVSISKSSVNALYLTVNGYYDTTDTRWEGITSGGTTQMHLGESTIEMQLDSGVTAGAAITYTSLISMGVLGTVINDDQVAAFDFTVKSENNANMFFIDSGTDRIGINEAAPQDTLELNGTMLIKGALKFTQDDGNESIDGTTDGQLTYSATNLHYFNNNILITMPTDSLTTVDADVDDSGIGIHVGYLQVTDGANNFKIPIHEMTA